MLSPEHIHKQLRTLTADLIGLSICDSQNYPVLCDLGKGIREINISGKENISLALKNISYKDVYEELDKSQTYNVKMLDGALIHMMYRFRDGKVESHRLAFFPSPSLEEYQSNPAIYIEDDVYAEVTMKNIVPFPLRFDFDCRQSVVVEVEHPASHMTLGQYKNCRIPVSGPVTPFDFMSFVLRNFYNTAFRKLCSELTVFRERFNSSITFLERDLLHLQIPGHGLPAQ